MLIGKQVLLPLGIDWSWLCYLESKPSLYAVPVFTAYYFTVTAAVSLSKMEVMQVASWVCLPLVLAAANSDLNC